MTCTCDHFNLWRAQKARADWMEQTVNGHWQARLDAEAALAEVRAELVKRTDRVNALKRLAGNLEDRALHAELALSRVRALADEWERKYPALASNLRELRAALGEDA